MSKTVQRWLGPEHFEKEKEKAVDGEEENGKYMKVLSAVVPNIPAHHIDMPKKQAYCLCEGMVSGAQGIWV